MIPTKTVEELILKHSTLEKDLSSGEIDKKELKGGSITITSLGGIGGTFFTPIINPPLIILWS